jgi:HlyD family type I secretion membrane fusion protein
VQRQFATLAVNQASGQLSREGANLSKVKKNFSTAQQNQRRIQAAYDEATGADKSALQAQLTYANNIERSASEAVDTMQDRVNAAQSAFRQAQTSLAELDSGISDGALGTVVDQDKNIAQIESELEKARKNIKEQSVYAPVNGRVMSLAVNALGNVVGGGQQVAIIVPTDTSLVIESSLQNQDIGFVHVGQRVVIKIDSFSFQRYGVLEGEVESISPDAIQDESTGALTYKVRVKIKSNESSKERAIPLQSGMSVTSEIKTGDRRIISFFLDPLFGGLDESFKVR